MPNFSNFLNKAWVGSSFDADPAWIMARDSESLTVVRNGASVGPLTVRIVPEPAGGRKQETPRAGNVGVSSRVVVIGGGSLNIQVDDRFTYQGRRYKVASVDKTMPNKTEAYCDGVE